MGKRNNSNVGHVSKVIPLQTEQKCLYKLSDMVYQNILILAYPKNLPENLPTCISNLKLLEL